MIKVAALTSGKHFPSSRFRIRQFIVPLQSFGIEISEHYPFANKYHTKRLVPVGMLARLPGVLASRQADVTLFERELLPGRFTLERFAGTKRLVDIDDALWLNADRFSEKLARLCDGVIAGNRYIAQHYQHAGARVWVVPTSIDTDKWRPANSRAKDRWSIGWTGTSSNLKYLSAIEEPLAAFLNEHQDTELLVVCDRQPAFKKLPPQSWRFVRWTPDTEVESVQSMDVGLMPLPDTEWTRGKCALKMIMYLAAGVPAIVSPVGVAKEILAAGEVGLSASDDNDWYESLTRLYNNRELSSRLAASGRRLVEEEFSVHSNAPKLAAVIREVAE
ncbi:MAG TPA: glycosyltransferase family 4 protein [Pyrinomonadaceae bacterium]|nr:glycosyltransferase family 4 protein [Pyrinomonadaceae bacterium]